jgi:hypothetical protein
MKITRFIPLLLVAVLMIVGSVARGAGKSGPPIPIAP